MAVNLDKPHLWKSDIARSVDAYNAWFLKFAPKAFRETRSRTTRDVEDALRITDNLVNIGPAILREHPGVLPTLRMSTCPPIAVDRLIGLSGVSPILVKGMDSRGRLPSRWRREELDAALRKIGAIIKRMADRDIFVWLGRNQAPTRAETRRAATIVADRLCGAVANPIIRNAQETRQLAAMKTWLAARGYRQIAAGDRPKFSSMPPGTYSLRTNVPAKLEDGKEINIPIDAVIMSKGSAPGDFPIFFEAKSAGDFTNVNKRRKEEANKVSLLRRTYGAGIQFNLFLCGYFNSGYLGFEAAEGIDWVWEHRIDDLIHFGL